MHRHAWTVLVALVLAGGAPRAQSPANPYVRDPKQAIDEAYTRKRKE